MSKPDTTNCANCGQPMSNGPGGTGPWCWEDNCNEVQKPMADSNTTEVLREVVRLARELVATADLSEPRRMTTTVSSDHLAELMEALEDAESV